MLKGVVRSDASVILNSENKDDLETKLISVSKLLETLNPN